MTSFLIRYVALPLIVLVLSSMLVNELIQIVNSSVELVRTTLG